MNDDKLSPRLDNMNSGYIIIWKDHSPLSTNSCGLLLIVFINFMILCTSRPNNIIFKGGTLQYFMRMRGGSNGKTHWKGGAFTIAPKK